MEKIHFRNKKPPYVSDINLNQMQDNVENAINDITATTVFEYSNTNIKSRNIVFRKTGRVVQFVSLGDIHNLPQGENVYIEEIDESLRPADDIPQVFMINNRAGAYIILMISGTKVLLGNYSGADITQQVNGGFNGTYIAKSDQTAETDSLKFIDDIKPRQITGHNEIINILSNENTSENYAMLVNATEYSEQTGYTTTERIDVKPGDLIYLAIKNPTNICTAVLFDRNGSILEKILTTDSNTEYGKYQVPEKAKYIRFTVPTDSLETMGAYLGTEETLNEHKKYNVSDLNWLQVNKNNLSQELKEKIEDIQPHQITGHDEIINILNMNNASSDIAMRSNASAYTTVSGYSTTDFIRVKAGEKIFIDYSMPRNVFSFVCFDKNKNIVSKKVTATDWTRYGLYTVEDDVEFIKFTIQTSQIPSRGVYLGATEAPEEYKLFNETSLNWLKIRESNLDEDVKKIISDLQEKNKKLETQIPKGHEEGESIHLTDSSDLKASISIKGNAKQEGTPSVETESPIETVKDNIKIIKRNKNFLYVPDYTLKYNGVTSECKNGVVNVTGTLNTTWFFLTSFVDCFIKKGNYRFSFNKELPRVEFKVKNKDNKVTTFAFENKKAFNVNLKENAIGYQIAFAHLTANAEYTNSNLTFQLEIGSVETEHEINLKDNTFVLPIQKEFAKIGDYQDVFVKKDDGNWYERHCINKVTFDGSKGTVTGSNNLAYVQIPASIIDSGGLCNYYKYRNLNQGLSVLNDNEFAIQVLSYGTSFYIKTSATTNDEFKNILKALYDEGKPIILYYPLATPEDILCTPEQTAILEELQQTETYKNETNIETDSIAIIEIDYSRDLETLFKKAGVL